MHVTAQDNRTDRPAPIGLLDRWRNRPRHRTAQKMGREVMFEDDRLRIAGVIRDYGMDARDEAPEDSRAVNG